MDKRYQVFVSSTFTDLREERAKAIQTLMEMDCIPAGMELFPAADEEQWNFIKKVIDDCDYYLLIIGGRYGSETPEGISFTEKEYEYAVERGLKVIALIHGAPDQIPAGKTERNSETLAKLAKFRDKVSTGRLVKFWTQSSELAGLVSLSLNKTIKTYPAIGWVRANAIANTEALTELNELRKRNKDLETQLAKLQEATSRSTYEGKTYEELADLLSSHKKVDAVVDGKSMKIDLLFATAFNGKELARGVSNAATAPNAERALFYNVASPLALHGLADFLPVPRNAAWQRLALTELGKRFAIEAKARLAKTTNAAPPAEGDLSVDATLGGPTPPASPSERRSSHSKSRVKTKKWLTPKS